MLTVMNLHQENLLYKSLTPCFDVDWSDRTLDWSPAVPSHEPPGPIHEQ